MTLRRPTTGTALWVQLALLILVTAAIRLVDIGHVLVFDEIYHMLAGRSWSQEGTLRIADGSYDRAALFTILVGELFSIFGESPEVARMPALVAGLLWIVGIFLWVRWLAGDLAGWTAALLFGLSPKAIWLSQYVRFYTLHGLAFWIGTVLVYLAATQPWTPRRRIAAGVGALVCFALAMHLHIVTLVGLAGLGLWLTIEIYRVFHPRIAAKPYLLLWPVGAIAVVAAIAVATMPELFARLDDLYRKAPTWNKVYNYSIYFYYYLFLERYPALSTLLPIAAIAAIAYRAKAALLCICIFGVAFAVHSIAAFKAERYIYYAIPFFFALWGIAIGSMAPGFVRLVQSALEAAVGTGRPWPGKQAVVWTAVATVAAALLTSNTILPATAKILAGLQPQIPPAKRINWAGASDILRPAVAEASVVVTTDDTMMLYFLGDFDIVYSPSRLSESRIKQEFTHDGRTGRPIISTDKSLQLVFDCFDSGILVAETRNIGKPGWLEAEAAKLLVERTEAIDLPEHYRISAYRWHRRGEPPPECATLPSLR